jgi:DNA-binding NarL/FixJ family response regulator
MFVITADQRASTRVGDRVDRLQQHLAPWFSRHVEQVALPLERTVGDEVQTVLTTADAALDLALALIRVGGWSVGIGAGPDEPLAASARESAGAAFVAARAAVERAKVKSEPVPLVVGGTHDGAAEAATAVVQLLAGVIQRRSAAGWEVADLLARGRSQREAAERLEVSEQAVSQRVASAMINEERRARPVAARLIEAAGR